MKREIQTAVKWWSQWLTTRAPLDAGDGQVNAVTNFLADMHRDKAPEITEKQIVAFEEDLRIRLETRAEYSEGRMEPISVDYEPGATLSASLRAAGIEWREGLLPIKTVMWLEPDRVAVKCGYRHPIEELEIVN